MKYYQKREEEYKKLISDQKHKNSLMKESLVIQFTK
jgi:hypothetical protein